jgi:hydrogenase maturation protein HypF
MTAVNSARQIDVNGIVQGVGFRPFIYQLAATRGLRGQVVNTASGVTIHVEGTPAQIDAFIADISAKKPPLATIVELQDAETKWLGHEDFRIAKSTAGNTRATLISPDVCVCADCRRELFDPADRRYGFPFINCTNCGPRYTIINDIPYDRPKTSMHPFTMCAACQAEYDDPNNRRFHAQPNACSACGPKMMLHDPSGRTIASEDPITRAAELLKEGHILAVKGLGGFHLAVDATNDAAVERLRRRKHREEKPLAVMSADLDSISRYAEVTPEESALLDSIQRPIVLLAKKQPETLAFSVAPRNRYYGVMLPYTPLHYLLLSHGFTAVVMTSGNLSEEPIAIDNDEALRRLKDIADYFLFHDRDIILRSDDSIVRRAAGATRPIRRSRGYVPIPLFLKEALPSVLACGAELKNTICLTKGRQAFISQHIGDLENMATEGFFHLTIDHLQRILDIQPKAIACDLHPDYLSTQWARHQARLPVIAVQHHHAHVAACMAEHHLDGSVIGLALDGTGLGSDGTIWGGEVLVADTTRFLRAGCLDPVPMPGSAAAIREPWRMALSYLHHTMGDQLWHSGLPLLERLDRSKAEIIVQMCADGFNAPMTSSLGRLFDGVAAIVGLRTKVAYEGQAAMELEMMAQGTDVERYPFTWTSDDTRRIDLKAIIAGVVEDLVRGLPAYVISIKFHHTLAEGFAALCGDIAKTHQIDRVALSGGCFQNRLLLESMTAALSEKGLSVFIPQLAPVNDGGISLGQAVIAAAQMRRDT